MFRINFSRINWQLLSVIKRNCEFITTNRCNRTKITIFIIFYSLLVSVSTIRSPHPKRILVAELLIANSAVLITPCNINISLAPWLNTSTSLLAIVKISRFVNCSVQIDQSATIIETSIHFYYYHIKLSVFL